MSHSITKFNFFLNNNKSTKCIIKKLSNFSIKLFWQMTSITIWNLKITWSSLDRLNDDNLEKNYLIKLGL